MPESQSAVEYAEFSAVDYAKISAVEYVGILVSCRICRNLSQL